MREVPFDVKVSRAAERALAQLPPLVRIRARFSLTELARAVASAAEGPWERLFLPPGLSVDVGGVVLRCAASRRARRLILREVEAGARQLFKADATELPLWRSRFSAAR